MYTLRKNGQKMQGIVIKDKCLAFTRDDKRELNRRAKANGYENIEEWLVSRIVNELVNIDDRLPLFQVYCQECNYKGDTNEKDWCPKCEKYL